MITYDKSRKAWNFKEADEDEKEAMMEMAQEIWAKTMAFEIARQMMEQAAQDIDPPTEQGISIPMSRKEH